MPSTASSIIDLALFSDNRLGVFVKSGQFSTTFELTTPLEFAAQTHNNGAGVGWETHRRRLGCVL